MITNETRNALALTDLKMIGGIVARGAWQSGTGNYKKARSVPVGASEYTKYDVKAPERVLAWFVAHPRALRCVAIDL